MKHFRSLSPQAIAADRLASILRLNPDELAPLAQRSQLPFSFSAEHGLWIHKNDLDTWYAAADAFRRNRHRENAKVEGDDAL